MCVGIEFIAFNVLLHTKYEQKKIRKKILNRFFKKKNTFKIYVGRVWIVIRHFLLEKHAFNGLLKVIGIYIVFKIIK